MKGRVLLVNPWIYDFAAYDLWAAPLGLLYLAAILRQEGCHVDYLDCLDRYHPALLARQGRESPKSNPYGCGKYEKTILEKPPPVRSVPRRYGRYGLPLDLFDAELERLERPDAVLVTSGMTYWYPGPFEAIRRVKVRFPGVPVILGGIYATLCYDHAVAHSGADYVIAGPAETRIASLVCRIMGGEADAITRYETLDDLPYPAFDLRHGLGFVAIATSRGCPMRCTYCASYLLYPPGFRRRKARAVVEEIEYWHVMYGVQDVAFYDDALLFDAQNHIHAILDEVTRRGLRCRFHTPNGLHARLITPELAEKMFAAGFKTVRLSLETVNIDRQETIGSKVTPEEFRQAAMILRQAGFTARELGAYILMGLPGQPLQEVIDSIRYAHDCGIPAYPAFYSPIPGTVEWGNVVRAGHLAADADPLLHNDTIHWMLRGYASEEACQRVKDLAREGNKQLASKPITDNATKSV